VAIRGMPEYMNNLRSVYSYLSLPCRLFCTRPVILDGPSPSHFSVVVVGCS
jgi:hypothetical protein